MHKFIACKQERFVRDLLGVLMMAVDEFEFALQIALVRLEVSAIRPSARLQRASKASSSRSGWLAARDSLSSLGRLAWPRFEPARLVIIVHSAFCMPRSFVLRVIRERIARNAHQVCSAAQPRGVFAQAKTRGFFIDFQPSFRFDADAFELCNVLCTHTHTHSL